MPLDLIILALLLAAGSGLPGLCLPRGSLASQLIAVGCMSGAALAGLTGAGLSFFYPGAAAWFPWPAVGNSWIGVDALSAFFLVPIFVLGGLNSIYALAYYAQRRHLRNGRQHLLFWGLLVAGLVLLVISKHAMAFLLGWEFMALSAFFLVSLEDQREQCRRAGWIYLIATHIGTLTLFGLFILWRWATGSFALQPVAGDTISLGVLNGIFILALLAFGIKAGMMPLHFWLPTAHANAPSHVSAMLSGVVLKMGIYGLLRFFSLLPNPPFVWGGLLLGLGAASGVLGVVFAIGQHDLKRLLAYHSVENIGIILMGLGLAMLGRSYGRPEWVVLGMAGCLLHVWNHAFFKGLLFLSAGSVLHATGTRRLDRLGGLAKTMPWTAAMFLVGAAAICGLPPLNGFVSEWLVYLGLLRAGLAGGASGATIVIAAPVLALIGALALACFVKAYSTVFSGIPRSTASAYARESPLAMRGPMLLLAAACALIGLVPVMFAPLLDRVIAVWWPGGDLHYLNLRSLVPLRVISNLSVCLLALIGVAASAVFLAGKIRRHAATWDCGYAAPTGRMQYTASSFARSLVAMFAWFLRPHTQQPHVAGVFPEPASLQSHVDDAVLDRLLVPAFHNARQRFGWFRQFQHGLAQNYILYILIVLVLLLGTLLPFKEIFTLLIAR